jgi:Rhodopirellula transposase DDE domain
LIALEALLRDATAGDPMKGIRWTRKTVKKITRTLEQQGYQIKQDTTRRLMRGLNYRLRVNRKRLIKKQNPDRDRQMGYVVRKRHVFVQAEKPVISIDCKKRELVGNFNNKGRTWRKARQDVLENDYPSDADGVAIPYGIYDVARNHGFVVVGTSHQTSAFAVKAIRRWWLMLGHSQYPNQNELLIEADCGGANASDSGLWKWELQQFANEFNLIITVTHLPTGASKWNPIEHRLFSQISANWEGEPLIDYETIMNFIRTTQTDTGLRCRGILDNAVYPTGLKMSIEQQNQIHLKPHRVLPKWNYTILPQSK